MSFGLTNAPATFQRLIDAVFGPEMELNVFGYLDDIIIATDSFEEHKKGLEIVLTKIRDAQLTGELEEVRIWMLESSLPGVPVRSRRATVRYGEVRASSAIPRF